MPECRDNEGGEIVSEARFLSRDKSPIVDVVFKPEVNLMIPVLHHDLRWETELHIQDDDAIYLVEFFFSCFGILASVSQAWGDNLTIGDTPGCVVDKSLPSHRQVVVHNLDKDFWINVVSIPCRRRSGRRIRQCHRKRGSNRWRLKCGEPGKLLNRRFNFINN